MRVQQSVCLPALKPGQISFDEYFATLAGIGYKAVEVWGIDQNFADFCKTAAKHGLRVVSFIGVGSLDQGLNDAKNHERIEAEVKKSVDIAADNNVPGIIVFSGNRLPGQTDDIGARVAIEGLKRVAPIAEKKGVNLNLELLNSKVDHKGYLCDRTSWGALVVSAVNNPRVKLLYDIYHMQIMEGDVIRTIRENIQWIGHMHTAGVPGRKDPDESQELNYAAVAKAIAETNYAGYVGHEFWAAGDPIAAVRKAFTIFDQQ